MYNFIFQTIGLIGSVFIIVAFYFIQNNKNKMFFYNKMNLIGAILLLISLIKEPNLGSIMIEIFWIIISLYGIKKNN